MSTFLFLVVIALLVFGYLVYSKYLAKLFEINDKNQTPAHKHYDGVDYVASKNPLMLFGHHFASIAGAGPIIGPVLAYKMWGWLPTLLWIVIGTIFMGAVHDATTLIVSLRENGKSVGNVAEKYISKRAGKIFLVFLWWALIIIIAVFASICAKTFINKPDVVMPSLGLIPVALMVGFLTYRKKINLAVVTVFGLLSLVGLVFLGDIVPVVLGFSPEVNYKVWVSVLLVYAFFASVVPVNILLQPRDYISSFLLFFGLAVAAIGLFLKPVSVEGAKLISFNSSLGNMFPVMFITVACGAISGFHSLVSSGTTSKQLDKESQALKIGYGSMVMEAILAVVVLFAVSFGLKSVDISAMQPAEIFSLGFAQIVFFLGKYASFAALVILNAFILTTLDTATRIARLITQELLNVDNKWLATAIVVAVAGYFTLLGKWQILWPLFGSANQLVAALALIVVSCWLICKGKSCKVVVFPAIIMVIVTIYALILKIKEYLFSADINYTLGAVGIGLIILAIFTLLEFVRVLRGTGNEEKT